MRALPLALVLVTLGSWFCSLPAVADVIMKKDGRELIGKIIAEEEKRVQIEVQMGKMLAKIWVPRKEIASIERGRTPTEEFHERLAALAPHDVAGHKALAEYAKKRKLSAAESLVRSLLPRVELAAFKHSHLRTWCRTCDADGEALCVPCDGKGETLEACQRCQGHGSIPCKVCKGELGGKVRCRRCAGEGEYEKFDPARGRKVLQKCRDCNAKGELDCPICRGKGHGECPECKGSKGETAECKECLGKPKKVCPTCSGSKLQPTPVTDAELALEIAAAKKKEQSAAVDEKPKLGEGTGTSDKPEKKNPFDD